LGELGWVEGRTVAIEYRRTDARKECFTEIAAEFVRRKVDTLSATAIATVKQETSTIPIVFAVAVDPERILKGENQWLSTSCLRASLTKEPKRTDAFKEMAKKCGATVRDAFWTLGEYDMVAIVEAPDDISMTALGLSSGALGNVRTQTLRALRKQT
jgi:uncharacterized protein with GYD domain